MRHFIGSLLQNWSIEKITSQFIGQPLSFIDLRIANGIKCYVYQSGHAFMLLCNLIMYIL